MIDGHSVQNLKDREGFFFFPLEKNLLHIIQQPCNTSYNTATIVTCDHVTMKDGPKYVVLEFREGVCFLGVGVVHGEAETSRWTPEIRGSLLPPLSLDRAFHPLFPHLDPF